MNRIWRIFINWRKPFQTKCRFVRWYLNILWLQYVEILLDTNIITTFYPKRFSCFCDGVTIYSRNWGETWNYDATDLDYFWEGSTLMTVKVFAWCALSLNTVMSSIAWSIKWKAKAQSREIDASFSQVVYYSRIYFKNRSKTRCSFMIVNPKFS